MNEKRLWKLFLLPSLGGVLVFYLLPFVLSLYYGMIDNMGSRQFVGLQNIVETLKNPMFLQAAGNTAVYLGLSIPLILLISLGLAFLLHRGNRTLLFALLVPLVTHVVGETFLIVAAWAMALLFLALSLGVRSVERTPETGA